MIVPIILLVGVQSAEHDPGRLQSNKLSSIKEDIDEQYEKCLSSGDAGLGITSAMINCGVEALTRYNKLLDARYAILLSITPARQRPALQRSTARWSATYGRPCFTAAERKGGTAGSLTTHPCLMEKTARRIEWIEGRIRKVKRARAQ